MSKSFSYTPDEMARLKRVNWDMSFQNNLTLNFGKAYPVFCKEVIAGDTWKIKPTFGLNFLPMKFPVQTRMYAKIYFFYCRNRAVWPQWKEFITHVPDENGSMPELPYLNPETIPADFFKVGSLGDYFGIPTNSTTSEPFANPAIAYPLRNDAFAIPISTPDGTTDRMQSFSQMRANNTYYFATGEETDYTYPLYAVYDVSSGLPLSASNRIAPQAAYIRDFEQGNHMYYFSDFDTEHPTNTPMGFVYIPFSAPAVSRPQYMDYLLSDDDDVFSLSFHGSAVQSTPMQFFYPINFYVGGQYVTRTMYCEYVADGTFIIHFRKRDVFDITNGTTNFTFANFQHLVIPLMFGSSTYPDADNYHSLLVPFFSNAQTSPTIISITSVTPDGYTDAVNLVEYPVPVASGNPFVTGDIQINALPFRHYECIYNAYFRRQQVDTFNINGIPQYNRFVTNNGSGADSTTPLDFWSVNWEADEFTSCFSSPQQGAAPLVGVNYAGRFKFTNPDTGETYYAVPNVDEDGTLTGISSVSDNFPAGALQQLQHDILSGISINDFRQANSLQKYLEKNLFSGYRYRDLMKSHFGQKIHFNELDMPEYIGGVSRVIDVSKVLNNNGDGTAPLGSFAGLATAFGQSKHSIKCRCDEHGYIIGIMAITPIPIYTQNLPKHFIKRHFLDFYTPEFYNVGLQPIFNKQITPVEAYSEGGAQKLEEVFGYQKAWSDYMSSFDEAHGEFRDTLRNYVLYRKFGFTPQLGHSFLSIDKDQLNNVFAVDDDNDKILGQIWFEATAKRIVRRNVTPGL